MARLARELSSGLLHPRETLYATGNIGALNAEVITAADGSTSGLLDLRGTFNLTIEVSGSVDGTNWTPIPVRPLNQAAVRYAAAVVGAVAGVWAFKSNGYRLIRARSTAYTSGLAVATLSTSTSLLDDTQLGLITTDVVTTVGAVGAATTLTITNPGAGLRPYLTYLSVNRFATAALTAAAAPVTVTTTNIPGSLAFSFAADAMPQGTIDRWREDFAYAIGTTAQNTNTTIVCPATTNVIWRVTAGYYVAP